MTLLSLASETLSKANLSKEVFQFAKIALRNALLASMLSSCLDLPSLPPAQEIIALGFIVLNLASVIPH